jgi:hypothetical protein
LCNLVARGSYPPGTDHQPFWKQPFRPIWKRSSTMSRPVRDLEELRTAVMNAMGLELTRGGDPATSDRIYRRMVPRGVMARIFSLADRPEPTA